MKIGIIGAGVAGMSAAWDLVNAGHDVTLFEAEPRVGGLAAGFKDEGWDWWLEKFYHHWFQTDDDVLRLAEEMGVRDQILFPRPKTSFWIDGKTVRSEISPSAIFLPLSMGAKIHFGIGGARLKLMSSWQSLEKTTAHEWLLANMGQQGYDKFFRPLLIGKFGEEYQKVNMAWMWARVKARSLKLGTFTGGFQAFLDALAEAITANGATIHLNTPVSAIGMENGKPTLTVNGETQVFDRVLATTSPGLLLRLAPELRDTDYGHNIASLRTIGAVCVVLATREQLLTDGTYWLSLPATSADKRESRFPFLALVEHTNWMDRAHYNGDHILYLGDYVPVEHEYFSMTDEELIERFTAVLPTFNPDYKPDWIRKAWVFRAPYAQPVPYINHSEHVPTIETPLKHVFWASMNHVYPWDRGTNYAIELGRRAASQMMERES